MKEGGSDLALSILSQGMYEENLEKKLGLNSLKFG